MTLGGAPALALGLIEGVSDAAAAFCKLAGGRIADRLRRLKPATAAGYLATGLAIPAIGLATSWWQVLVLRTLGWCGRGFRGPLRDTLLVRSIEPAARGRAFGIERAMDQAGAVLAPLLVLWLLREGMSVDRVILLSVIPGMLAAAAMLGLVRESPPVAEAPVAPSGGLPPAATLPPAFRRLILVLAVFGSGDFAKTMLVLWAVGEGVVVGSSGGVTTAILLYAGFNAVTVLAAFAGGGLSDRFGRKPVLTFGYAVGASAALCPLLLPPGTVAGALALIMSGILVGIEETVERAWAADLAPEGRRGRAFGYVHATNGVGDMIASVLVGALWAAAGPQVAFGVAFVLMAAGTVMAATVPAGRAAP